jgi:hypothetical protein
MKVQCKEVKNTTSLLYINSVVNKTTGFGLLGGHHQVQQVLAMGDQYIPWNILVLAIGD